MTDYDVVPGGWKGYAAIFAAVAVSCSLWIATNDDVSDIVVDTARDRMAYTVAKAAFPYGGAACHTAAASDIKAIIADIDADMGGETIGILGYAIRDVDHANVELAVEEWIRDGPAAPYECSGLHGMRTDARDRGAPQ